MGYEAWELPSGPRQRLRSRSWLRSRCRCRTQAGTHPAGSLATAPMTCRRQLCNACQPSWTRLWACGMPSTLPSPLVNLTGIRICIYVCTHMHASMYRGPGGRWQWVTHLMWYHLGAQLLLHVNKCIYIYMYDICKMKRYLWFHLGLFRYHWFPFGLLY